MSAPVAYRFERSESDAVTAHYRITTRADAMALMRKASRYHAHVTMSAYLHSTEDQYKPGYYRACAELTKAAMTTFIESALQFGGAGDDEYMQVRLYTYYLPGRWNSRTGKEGAPRRRVTLYIG